MKIAYFGYDFFHTCLESVLEKHEVMRLFTFRTDDTYNFNEKVVGLARSRNVPVTFEKATRADFEKLVADGCELVVSAAYPYRIPVRKDDTVRAINIHPTLLPEGRGPWPLPHVILNRLEKSGVTLHKLAPEMDAGDILLKETFALAPDENLETLSCKCQMAARRLLSVFVESPGKIWDAAIPQRDGSYWPFPSDAVQTIDWNSSVEDALRTVRAFGKMESTAVMDGRRFSVQSASGWKEKHAHAPGTVVHRTNREAVVAVPDGFLCLRHFSPE